MQAAGSVPTPMNIWAILSILIWPCNTFSVSGTAIELNNSNVESTLSTFEYSLIYFYRDSCGWCHKFNPTFAHLAAIYEYSQPDHALQLLKCNGGLNERLVRLFRVTQFPTLLILQWDTKAITRFTDSERDLKSLTRFVQETSNVTVPESNSLVQALNDTLYDSLVGNQPSLIVFKTAYLEGWDTIELPIHFYLELAHEYAAIRFYFVDVFGANAGQIVRRFAVRDWPTVIYVDGDVFTRYNSEINTRSTGFAIGGISHSEAGKLTLESLQEFMESVLEKKTVWCTEKDSNMVQIPTMELENDEEWIILELG